MAKIRVYELAKEFGVESKAVMAKLEEMGEFVRSASSTIEAPVVRRLRQAFAIKNPHLGLADRPGVETDSETEKATEEPWLPLKMRLGDVPSQTAMQTGVPAALEQPLRDWIYDVANRAGDDTVQRSCLRLNLVMPNIKRNKDDPEEARRIFLAYDSPREGLLEVADAMLELIYQINKSLPLPLPRPIPTPPNPFGRVPAPSAPRPGAPKPRWNDIVASKLQELLTDVRSVYYVRDSTRGLERHANTAGTAEASEVFRNATSKIYGPAAEHLQTARDALDTLRPDPVKAYSEAIKAVEAAGHTLIEPDNIRPTLGTMIREIRTNPKQFSLTISGGRAETLGHMMGLLWFGQTARHGGQAYQPETQEQAEMAISLAETLVEWFLSGRIQRQSQLTGSRVPAASRAMTVACSWTVTPVTTASTTCSSTSRATLTISTVTWSRTPGRRLRLRSRCGRQTCRRTTCTGCPALT